MSDSVRPLRQHPTRLHHPWDSPGKNTGVGCHFLLHLKLLTTAKSITQIYEKERKRGREGRRKKGEEEERERESPNWRIKWSLLLILSTLFSEGCRRGQHSSSLQTAEFSSNLPQHGFTQLLFSHQGTSLDTSSKLGTSKVISDWLSH